MDTPSVSSDTSDTPAMAADRELLRDLAARLTRHGLQVDIDALRADALRHFVASLILDGAISYQRAEGFCLHHQVVTLNRVIQDHATKPR